MKNIAQFLLVFSLFITIIFSFSSVNAQEGKIDSLLKIQNGYEKLEFLLAEMPNRNFKSTTLQKKYNQMKKFNSLLIEGFHIQSRK